MRKRIKVRHRHVSSNTHTNTSLKGRQVLVCHFSSAVTCKHTNTCEGVQDLFYETSCIFLVRNLVWGQPGVLLKLHGQRVVKNTKCWKTGRERNRRHLIVAKG